MLRSAARAALDLDDNDDVVASTPKNTPNTQKKAPRTKACGANGWGRGQPKESLKRVYQRALATVSGCQPPPRAL